jgi:hypothetical protein
MISFFAAEEFPAGSLQMYTPDENRDASKVASGDLNEECGELSGKTVGKQKNTRRNCAPNEIRTRVTGLKSPCPRPLDDGGELVISDCGT